MSREIEFRGKRCADGVWVYGDYVAGDSCDVSFIFPCDITSLFCVGGRYEVYENTIGQFTGLIDKNGVKIFDGDIIRIYDSDYEEYSDHQVKFAHGVFGVDNWTGKLLTTLSFFMCGNDSEYSVEVIGNIYENPELLSTK